MTGEKYQYPSGQIIPQNVLKMVMYMGKVGILSTQEWHRYFSTGGSRWGRMQLRSLIEKDYLRPHSCQSFKDQWILGRRSADLLSLLKKPCVTPVPAHYVDHDRLVGISLLQLERSNIAKMWTTERELKARNENKFQLSNKDGDLKYPDALFKVLVKNQLRLVAMEYERRGKSNERYRAILWQYAGLTDLSLVLFICEDESIEKRVLSSLKYIGSPELNARVGFTDQQSWKNDPVNSVIRLNEKSLTFNQICSN